MTLYSRFVKAVDNMANGIVPSSDEFSAVNDNLALLVKKTDPNNFNGITMDVTSKSGSKLNANQVNTNILQIQPMIHAVHSIWDMVDLAVRDFIF